MSQASHHIRVLSALFRSNAAPLWILVLALPLLVGLTSLHASSALADDRPKEIEYDQPGPLPYLDPEYRQTRHETVIITDNALQPRLVTLNEGQLVAWISYSKAASIVVFEREVAKSMICHSLVNFSIVEDELRSAEIHTGEFASFCELEPGRYKYKVIRRHAKASGAGGAARRLEGEIIVGNVR